MLVQMFKLVIWNTNTLWPTFRLMVRAIGQFRYLIILTYQINKIVFNYSRMSIQYRNFFKEKIWTTGNKSDA